LSAILNIEEPCIDKIEEITFTNHAIQSRSSGGKTVKKGAETTHTTPPAMQFAKCKVLVFI